MAVYDCRAWEASCLCGFIECRLSPQSFKNWTRARTLAEKLLSSFTVIMTQTERDKEYFDALGGRSVCDRYYQNIAPLLFLVPLMTSRNFGAIGQRSGVYASTHQEEARP